MSRLSQQSASDVGPRCRHDSTATENRTPGFQIPYITSFAWQSPGKLRLVLARRKRRLSRTAARRQLTAESLGATMTGKTWRSDEAEALVDEHPLAYKNVKEMTEAGRDFMRIDQRLKQVLSRKGAKQRGRWLARRLAPVLRDKALEPDLFNEGQPIQLREAIAEFILLETRKLPGAGVERQDLLAQGIDNGSKSLVQLAGPSGSDYERHYPDRSHRLIAKYRYGAEPGGVVGSGECVSDPRERRHAIQHDSGQSATSCKFFVRRGCHYLDERRQAPEVGEGLQSLRGRSVQPWRKTSSRVPTPIDADHPFDPMSVLL